jgi:glycine oxidase
MQRLGLQSQVLDAGEAARRLPFFIFGADETILWSGQDGYLESTDLLDLVRRRSMRLGVQVRESVPVDSVMVTSGRASAVRMADGRTERADRIVVAGGAWTPGLLARSGLAIAGIPYRTQIATLEMAGADRLPVLHDGSFHFYARPESSTRMLAGDGTQLRPFDPETYNKAPDADFIEAMAARVVERFVGGRDVRYRNGWAGLCVGTPDQRPLVGPLPGVKDLFTVSGDNGFGLMRGLALGEVLAARIAGRSEARHGLLDPGRFGAHPPASFALAEGFSFPPA